MDNRGYQHDEGDGDGKDPSSYSGNDAVANANGNGVHSEKQNGGYKNEITSPITPTWTTVPAPPATADPTPAANTTTVHMKRQISLLGGVSVIVGTMIGFGIFITPNGLLKRTDSAATSLVVWAGCGVLATLAALSYCELGTLVQRSGGEHAYFMRAFGGNNRYKSVIGEIPAFLFAWMTATLTKPSSFALLGLAVGRYVLLPFIRFTSICDWWDGEADYELVHKMLAIFTVLTVTAINAYSAKLTERILIVLTAAKLAACGIVIVIGIYNLSREEYGGLPMDGYDKSEASFGKIALAFYSGLWAYDGWNNLNFLTEELVNPSRNLPLAIIIAIPLVTVLYVFMNVSYLTMMTVPELMASDAVGVEVGEKYLGPMKAIMPILVALSVFGTANGSQLTAGRITYVAGREGHLPSVLSYVHVSWLTPIISLALNAILATIMILYSDINELVDFFSFTSWIFYGLAMVSLLVLRFREPHAKRPIRIPFPIPIIALIISAYLVVAPVIDEPHWKHLLPLGYSIVGLIFYTLFVVLKIHASFMAPLTRGIQYITLVAPSPYKED